MTEKIDRRYLKKRLRGLESKEARDGWIRNKIEKGEETKSAVVEFAINLFEASLKRDAGGDMGRTVTNRRRREVALIWKRALHEFLPSAVQANPHLTLEQVIKSHFYEELQRRGIAPDDFPDVSTAERQAKRLHLIKRK